MAHQMSEDEDEARAALESIVFQARAVAAVVQHREPKSERDPFLLHLTAQIIEHAPKVLTSVEKGDAWAALRHMLWVGVVEGRLQAHPDLYHSDRKREAAEAPLRKQREGSSRGGRQKAGKYKASVAEIKNAYEEFAQKSRLSDAEVCRRVASKLSRQLGKSISARAVRNHLVDLKILPRRRGK